MEFIKCEECVHNDLCPVYHHYGNSACLIFQKKKDESMPSLLDIEKFISPIGERIRCQECEYSVEAHGGNGGVYYYCKNHGVYWLSGNVGCGDGDVKAELKNFSVPIRDDY